MEQNTEQKQIPVAPKRRMSGFRKALLSTAIPIAVLSLIGMTGMAGGLGGGILLGFLWWGGALYFVGALVALIVYAIIHERQVAAGILAGLGIGIVSLGATCFAGNALSGGYWF